MTRPYTYRTQEEVPVEIRLGDEALELVEYAASAWGDADELEDNPEFLRGQLDLIARSIGVIGVYARSHGGTQYAVRLISDGDEKAAIIADAIRYYINANNREEG